MPPCRRPCRPGAASRRSCCRCCATPRSRSATCRRWRSSASRLNCGCRSRGARRGGVLLVPLCRAAGRVPRAVLRQRRRPDERLGGPAARDDPAPVDRARQGLSGRPGQPRPHLVDRPVRPRARAAGQRPPGAGRGCRARRAAVRPDPGARTAPGLAARTVHRRGPRPPRRRDAERPLRPGEAIRAALARGAAAGNGPQATLDEIKGARLLGRGGAGFTTGVKWRAAAASRSRRASWSAMRTRASRHVQGPAAARPPRRHDLRGHDGRGLRHRRVAGFVYLRGEYRYLLDALRDTLERRRRDGLLGNGICGSAASTSTSASTSARARTCAARPRHWSSRWRASAAFPATGRRGSPRRATSGGPPS